MIRIGWIGCGTHASEMLLPQLVRLPVKIVALCDVDGQAPGTDRRPIRCRRALRPKRRNCWLDEELDAIGHGGRTGYSWRARDLQALSRGWPVFMEKPPAPTADAAQRLAERSRTVRQALHRRLHEALLDREPNCRQHLAEPGLSEPRPASLASTRPRPPISRGNPDYSGFLLHHCVHAMDLSPLDDG